MPNLIVRPSQMIPGKPWSLQLRYHESYGEVEYQTIAYLTDEVAREVIKAGEPYWLFGDPDRK